MVFVRGGRGTNLLITTCSHQLSLVPLARSAVTGPTHLPLPHRREARGGRYGVGLQSRGHEAKTLPYTRELLEVQNLIPGLRVSDDIFLESMDGLTAGAVPAQARDVRGLFAGERGMIATAESWKKS